MTRIFTPFILKFFHSKLPSRAIVANFAGFLYWPIKPALESISFCNSPSLLS